MTTNNKLVSFWTTAIKGAIALLLAALGVFWYLKLEPANPNEVAASQQLVPVQSAITIRQTYDVIVAGTDPEGVTAAISSARNGLTVLLVDGRGREMLGGLMTVGELNTIDLNYSPTPPLAQRLLVNHAYLNEGIFLEWFKKVEGSSFDLITAANAFYSMVRAEENIDLLMKAQEMVPIVSEEDTGKTVTGMHIVSEDGTVYDINSGAVIDATQDGDIAAAAGVPYTVGREDIGSEGDTMVATLVFRLSGVTSDIWDKLAKHKGAGSDDRSIWGYDEAKAYVSSDPEKVQIRGLNIGRQNDGTILINCMQLFGIDPLDPESVEEGLKVGQAEAPRIAEYLKSTFEEFKGLEYAGTASELYIRESRHIEGEYRLKLTDLLENRDQWDAIAYGSYPVDIQSISSGSGGTIMMKPEQYGIPFRTLVPQEIDGILVVGRAASYDTIPYGSARVIQIGMATAEAAGAAAKLAADNGVTFRELSQSGELIKKLRSNLVKQGMNLTMHQIGLQDYQLRDDYNGLVAAASMALISGGYDNNSWNLDEPSNPLRYFNKLSQIKKLHSDKLTGDPLTAIDHLDNPGEEPLTLSLAASMIGAVAGVQIDEDEAISELLKRGWLTEQTIETIDDPLNLTNGDGYMLIYDLSVSLLGLQF